MCWPDGCARWAPYATFHRRDIAQSADSRQRCFLRDAARHAGRTARGQRSAGQTVARGARNDRRAQRCGDRQPPGGVHRRDRAARLVPVRDEPRRAARDIAPYALAAPPRGRLVAGCSITKEQMMARSAADAMWAEALALLAQADHQRREFFRPAQVGWEPPIDVLETEVELVVVVVIGGSELAIVGTRRWPASLRSARVHRMELPHGRFERRLGLPPGTFEIVRHDLVDGCLTIALRKLG